MLVVRSARRSGSIPAAINPARDFGPRLFTFVAGWGVEVFRAGNAWWWVPIVGRASAA
jgi:glycerol uptake facilitator-like aquaporin